MTLTLDLDDKYQPAFDRRTTEDETAETIASGIVVARLEEFLVIDKADEMKALAGNDRLVALGIVIAAQPDKLDAVEEAVTKALA